MNELKDPAKKLKNYNQGTVLHLCTKTTAAAATTTTKIFRIY